MNKKDMMLEMLQRMGYKAKFDSDGDVRVMYQMKAFFVYPEDDDNFVTVIYPQFASINEGEDTLVLAVCNKMTSQSKVVKAYVDGSFENISASFEFYYTDDVSLENNLKQAIDSLNVTRRHYMKCKEELEG